VDRLNQCIELLPRLRRGLEPLGRICELLETHPHIEKSGRLRKLTLSTRASLESVLEKCETVKDAERNREATVLREALALEDGEAPVARGCSILAFKAGTADELPVYAKESLLNQDLVFPVTLLFSVKKTPLHFNGRVEFEEVHFRYPTDLRKVVLHGLSFTVEPHTKVALVGEAGCGKSSCMGLLQRLYDPLQGKIKIDGIDMREYNVNYLRSRVAIVDQRPVIFAASIRDNVTYGLHREVTDQEVIDVLHAASLWEGDNGIKSKPDQILTKLGSGGIALSGGQMQRVSIARVMIRNPDVILLDEATSALDNKNEKIVQAALDKLACRGSSLVIAHRLTTIKDSDKIVVMRKGKVAEQGTHDELLNMQIVREFTANGDQDVTQGIYRFLWELQFRNADTEEVPIKDYLQELSCIPSDDEGDEDLTSLPTGEGMHTPGTALSSVPASPNAAARRARDRLLTRASMQSLMELLEKDSICQMQGGGPLPLNLLRHSTAPPALTLTKQIT